MKKLSTFIMILILTLLTSYSVSLTSASASYFSNNKALDGIFAKLEKEFSQYKKDEVIPLEDMGEIIVDDSTPQLKRTSKKISDSQVKEAAQKVLNDLKAAVEVKEEYLGGLSAKEYKAITDHIEEQIFYCRSSEYGWDFEGKTVKLYTDFDKFDEWLWARDMEGNLGRMGKEKDEVNPADLQVKDKIFRYLNQSIQKGNKISPEILAQLPGKVEELFIERNLSRVNAAEVLSIIHRDIYTVNNGDTDTNSYDGSKSIEELIETYSYLMDSQERGRDEEKRLEYYEYPADRPSANAWKYITGEIIDGNLSEAFNHGFNETINLDELARLKFESRPLDENVIIDDDNIPADSPDYIKQAYIFGMIDNTKNLDKPLTRLEAARILGNDAIYIDWSDTLKIADCNQIPLEDQLTVASCLKVGMKTRYEKFEPQGKYTKEEAIIDNSRFGFGSLRNYGIPLSMKEPSQIIVGKDKINLLFQNNDEIKEYINENFGETVLSNIKLTGKYMRIDTGGALIEFFTPEKGIRFTIKNGTKYFDLYEGNYGPTLGYTIEPKVLKDNEKVDMNVQPDSVMKKLNAKLDAILAKIIKPGMTQEQKVKAIHDYVVLHVTYDSRYQDEQTVGGILTTIDKGRGVCGDYTLLFKDLCQRISIPCNYEMGNPITLNHAWNAVYINGDWKFVDTTWDDRDDGKVRYTYFLKDKYTFMKDHEPWMGVPDINYYTYEIDPMKIKDQYELRAYLLKKFRWADGYKLTFRMTDKNLKPFIGYLHEPEVNVALTYDSKNNLYTVTAKAKAKK